MPDYQRAYRLICRHWDQLVEEMAEDLCELEEDVGTGASFSLQEFEQRFGPRVQCIGMILSGLESKAREAPPPPPPTNQLATLPYRDGPDLAASLEVWVREHPHAEVVHIRSAPAKDGAGLLLILYQDETEERGE